MSDDFKKNALNWLSKAGAKAEKTLNDAKSEYDDSDLKTSIDSASKKAKVFLDESGVSDRAQEFSDIAGDSFDKVSGKSILDLVEKRLDLQSEYNDVLASKLDEALTRIEKLEAQIKAKSK